MQRAHRRAIMHSQLSKSPPGKNSAEGSDDAAANEWLGRMMTRSELTPASAGQQFATWLASHASNARFCVLCHSDADGISAGAILHRALQRSGREVGTIVTQKFENAWSESVRDRVQATSPRALIVCDLGVRARPVLAALPTCFVDHHYFSDAPSDGVVITGFQVEPCPTSGLIAFWCASGVVDVLDLKWIAAISLLSDSGERAPFEELTSAKSTHSLSALREATTLLNSASILEWRRAACPRVAPACHHPERDFSRAFTRSNDLARGAAGGPSRLCRG